MCVCVSVCALVGGGGGEAAESWVRVGVSVSGEEVVRKKGEKEEEEKGLPLMM
jgi:hypothetical protein